MPFSNVLSNKLDDFVNTFDKEDIINCYQTRNATSPWLLNTERNRIADHSKIKEKALTKNKPASQTKIEKRTIKKNRVAEYFQRGEERENINKDISKISFLNQRIIKYN